MAFNYKKYEEDEKVKQYGSKAANYESATEAALKRLQGGTSTQVDVNDALNKVLNREQFKYNMAEDGLYDQYAKQYKALGLQAMKDTTAKAAELTGGYGNSYGVTAGNQAYQGYLNQLNDMVPQLYAIAQDRYNAETQQLMNNYGLLAEQEATEYNRLQNELANQQAMAQYYGNRYDTLAGQDYSKWADNRTFDYGVYADDQQMAYARERDAIADAQWEKQYALSKASGGSSGRSWSIDDTKTLEEIINNYFPLNENGKLSSKEENIQLYSLLAQHIPQEDPLFSAIFDKYSFDENSPSEVDEDPPAIKALKKLKGQQ